MYHYDKDGKYDWKPENVKRAHDWCKSETEYAMEFGHRSMHGKFPLHTVVVSNTFTQEWEMEDYYKLAEKHGYIVFSLIVENRHGGENIHNVPQAVLDKMKGRFNIKL